MLKPVNKDDKVYHALHNYNLSKVNYDFIFSDIKSILIKRQPNISKKTIKYYRKAFNPIMSLLFKRSELCDTYKSNAVYFSDLVYIPKNRNFYTKKGFNTYFKEYPYAENLVKSLCIGADRINNLLSAMRELNMIHIDGGGPWKFTVSSWGVKDKPTYEKRDDGKFRNIRLVHIHNWKSVKEDKKNYISIMNDYVSFINSKKDRKNLVNVYNDESKDSEGNDFVFDEKRLKHRTEGKRKHRTSKKDSLHEHTLSQNRYLSQYSSTLNSFRSFGKNNEEFGRYYSIYNRLPKFMRNHLNEALGINNEIDIDSCTFNVLCLTLTGKFFEYTQTKNDVYLALLLNIKSFKAKFVKTESFLKENKIDYKNDNFTYFGKSDKNEKLFVEYHNILKYRGLGKALWMRIFGTNTYFAGKEAINLLLQDTGLYYVYSNTSTTFSEIDFFFKSEINKIESASYDNKEVEKERLFFAKKLKFKMSNWEDYCKNTLKSDDVLPQLGISSKDIDDSLISLFNNEEQKEILNYTYTNIYSYSQYIESNVLSDCIDLAAKKNIIIGHAHDAIFVSGDNKEEFAEYQIDRLKKYTRENKNKLIALKNKQIEKGKNLEQFKYLYNHLEEKNKLMKSLENTVTDAVKDLYTNKNISTFSEFKKEVSTMLKSEKVIDSFIQSNKEKYSMINNLHLFEGNIVLDYDKSVISKSDKYYFFVQAIAYTTTLFINFSSINQILFNIFSTLKSTNTKSTNISSIYKLFSSKVLSIIYNTKYYDHLLYRPPILKNRNYLCYLE